MQMANVLYIAPIRQLDGWGVAARKYLRALATQDVNITVKPFYPGNTKCFAEPDLYLYELTKYDKYDAVIQNSLPYYFVKDSSFGKNIGLTAFETGYWKNNWESKIEEMDHVIVPSVANIELARHYSKISAIPEPCDPHVYDKQYPKIEELKDSEKVIFYWIGEYVERKNLDLAIEAFHLAFDPDDDVEFCIKTNLNGVSSNDLAQMVERDLVEIKNKLRIHPSIDDYKREFLITDYIPEDKMYGLHQSCDVFVMPSSGEAWSIPMFDACFFGNYILSTATGCFNEIKYTDRVYEIESIEDIVRVERRPYPDLFTPREYWLKPSVKSLIQQMRLTYKLVKEQKKIKSKPVDIHGLEIVDQFSYSQVGKKLVKCLL